MASSTDNGVYTKLNTVVVMNSEVRAFDSTIHAAYKFFIYP